MTFERLRPDWQRTGQYWFDLLDRTPRDVLCWRIEPPAVGTRLTDDAAMFLAWATALKGVGYVSPNPLVGAVLLDRDGGFLAAGAHMNVGEGHAEVMAISNLRESLGAVSDADLKISGGTMVVTLEPCAHEGRTPSCARMLAKSGVSRVVYGLRDPNPKVNGEGASILAAAGKSVSCLASWQSRCEWLARVFIANQTRGKIFTALKAASTPAGVIAGESSSRLWITGERARQMGHFLRLEYDAMIVGIRTVIMDDPTLNVRHPVALELDRARAPLRVILDPRGELALDSRSLRVLAENPDTTLVIVSESHNGELLRQKFGVDSLILPLNREGHFEWQAIKSALWARGVRSILIEGGASVYQSVLNAGEVDVIHWFVAPPRDISGLKWIVPSKLLDIYNSGGGVALGDDKLLEGTL